MPYFLSDKNLEAGKLSEISGDDVAHILFSHRVKIGERIKLQGPDGKRYKVEIREINRNTLSCVVLEEINTPPEPSVAITLFQSIVSEKALDFIFQKGTELGLSSVVLFNSANSSTKLSLEGFKKKEGRWNKILMEAAKQCERVKPPKLFFELDLEGAIKLMDQEKIFLADAGGDKPVIFKSSPPTTLGLIVGPEGGLAENEIGQLKTLENLGVISLGPYILRAETAALAGISIIQSII